ncbi:MAG: creatininase family protein [Terrimicrobiaceae bacterium]|nr:creatininase family protein [Terrimicrobiaceae bacterium]
MSLPADTLAVITAAASGRPIFLEELSWPKIGALREQNGGLLLLPLGATEQHGPHLPICTDTLIATSACASASARTGVPVLPPLAYTVSSGHTAKWPGTFSLRHETLIASLREVASWCAATGWRRLLLVNSHFGNDASMRAAVEQIRIEHLGRLQIGARNTYQLTPEIWLAFTADAADLHANKAETDLLLHLAPGLVRRDQLATADDPDRTAGSVFSHPVAQTSLNGVTGFPSRANAADGAALFAKIADALTALVERAKTDAPPLGPEHWTGISQ